MVRETIFKFTNWNFGLWNRAALTHMFVQHAKNIVLQKQAVGNSTLFLAKAHHDYFALHSYER